MSCCSQRKMWHNILVEEEASIKVHKRETSLMPNPSPEENSHVFIVENLDTFKRIVDALRKTKVLRTMSNPERFLRRRVLPP